MPLDRSQRLHSINTEPYPTTSSMAASPTSSNPDSLQALALRQHQFRRNQVQRQETEAVAARRSSASGESAPLIAENAVPLALMKPSPLSRTSAGLYSGRDPSNRFLVSANRIKLAKSISDGNAVSDVPSALQRKDDRSQGLVDYYHPVIYDNKRHKKWRTKLGTYIGWNVFGKRDGNWSLVDFPVGYSLWQHTKGSVHDIQNARNDFYLYGGGHIFRSPEEFAPHLIWLMLNQTCICQYCDNSRTQKEITALLTGKTLPNNDGGNSNVDQPVAVSDDDSEIEIVSDVQPAQPVQQRHRPFQRNEQVPAQAIQAKDYRTTIVIDD